jgi:GDSL-like Lipase/Acylhydrolase
MYMSAMNGSVASCRVLGRLIGCCLALVFALWAILLAPSSAGAQPVPGGPIYMALGDSISFGYTEQKFLENYPTESPSQFEEGVVNFFNKKLKRLVTGVTAENFACPGETSNGLIGEDEALGGMTSTEETSPPAPYQGLGDWHPCAYHNVDGFPLHAGFGELSQLEDAISVLTSENRITGKPNEVKAITLNIGSNDELAAISQCKDEVAKEFETKGTSKWGSSPQTATLTCIANTAVNVTIPHVVANTADILTVLDSYYSGPIVLLGFYNPDAFVLQGSDLLQKALNEAIEALVGEHFSGNVTIANPFPVFNKGAGTNPAKEKEAICKFTEMCNPNVQTGEPPVDENGDIHPSLAGYKKLAALTFQAYKANPAK